MAATVLVDAGFLVALIARRDSNHAWAAAHARQLPPPWATCEAVLSEAVHLLGARGAVSLIEMLRRGAIVCRFQFGEDVEAVLKLLEKYADVPISLADACLVRMTETLDTPVVLTTDADFRIYRRHGRQAIPFVLPR